MATKMVRTPIEIDITYTNKSWYSHHKKVSNQKHYVIGLFQRQGKAIIRAIDDNEPETIEKVILSIVQKGAMIYAEENLLPRSMLKLYEVHEFQVDAGGKVNGDIHVNNVKNMWRDLKRSIKREYISVSAKHLQLYCDEVVWRVNNANLTPMERFNALLGNCKRTEKSTYNDLIKKPDRKNPPGIVPPASLV